MITPVTIESIRNEENVVDMTLAALESELENPPVGEVAAPPVVTVPVGVGESEVDPDPGTPVPPAAVDN